MPYTKDEACALVIKAGHELVEKKLIARTWGNISARISDEQFVITPSGRSYESLKPEDLVVVSIGDCSYTGDIKPSSEKGIHADGYRLRPDVNFIIHTHQLYASAVGVEGKETASAAVCGYGLPGTKKLRRSVSHSVSLNADKNAFLMKAHGALCFGKNYEEAFKAADTLETECRELYEKNRHEVSETQKKKPWLDDYAQIMGNHGKPTEEDEETMRLITEKNTAAAQYACNAKPLGFFDVFLQHLVYKKKYSKLKK